MYYKADLQLGKEIQSGKEAHLCTHRHAPGSTRIQSLLYLMSAFTALLTRKKISKQAEKHLVHLCTELGSSPLRNGVGEEKGKNQSTN